MSVHRHHQRHRVPLTLRDFFFVDPHFSRTWTDFDRLYRTMLDENKTYWTKQDEEQKQQIQQNKQNKQNKQNQLSLSGDEDFGPGFAPWFFPRAWLLPQVLDENQMRKLDLFQHATGDQELIRLSDAPDKFEISLDVQGFKPDELKIRIDGNELSVEGRHEEKSEKRFVAREFRRDYTLPKTCQKERVRSNLSSDGVLVITAPKAVALDNKTTVTLPIEFADKRDKVEKMEVQNGENEDEKEVQKKE